MRQQPFLVSQQEDADLLLRRGESLIGVLNENHSLLAKF